MSRHTDIKLRLLAASVSTAAFMAVACAPALAGGEGGYGGYHALPTEPGANHSDGSGVTGEGGRGGDGVSPGIGGAGGISGSLGTPGGDGVDATSPGFDGGGGGGGGTGAVLNSDTTVSTTVTGGNGGAGGDAGDGAGGGGGGGAGIVSRGNVMIESTSTVTGGDGGRGGVSGLGATRNGGGGGGGAGLVGSGITITNSGTITGGNGGDQAGPVGALGGRGGFGEGGGSPADRSGGVSAGGVGIQGSDLVVINAGTIAGGLGGNGVVQAEAVDYFGGINVFETRAGGSVIGRVKAFSQADTFRWGGSSDFSFDVGQLDSDGVDENETYYNFGIFEKIGTGTTTLTGTNDEIGSVAVNAGGLLVNGTMAGTAFTVGSGALLGGTGSLGSAVINSGGTLASGSGTLSVTGGVTFNAGSTYAVTIDDANNSGLVAAGGPVVINGGTMAVTAVPGSYSAANRYTVLTGSSVTGQFSGVIDNLPDLDVYGIYDATSVQLGLRAQAVPPGPDPDPGSPFFSFKQNGLAAAYGAGNAAMAFTGALGSSGTCQALPNQTSVPLKVVQGPAEKGDYTIGEYTGLDCGAGADGLSAWVNGFGDDTSIDARGGAFGYDSRTGGLAGGLQYKMTGVGRTVLGLGVGYSHTDVDVTDGSADVDAAHIGIYASHEQGNLSLAGALGYSWLNYDLSRSIAGGTGSLTANGDANGHAISGYAEAFYDVAGHFGLDDVKLGPVVRLRGVYATRDAYTETGAGVLNLSVGRDSVSQLYGAVGGRIGTTWELGNLSIRPELQLLYERTLDGYRETSISAIPVAGASFETAVTGGSRDRFVLGAGASFDFTDNLSAEIRYEGSFGSGTTVNSGSLGLTYRF